MKPYAVLYQLHESVFASRLWTLIFLAGCMFVFLNLEILLLIYIGNVATAFVTLPTLLFSWMINRKAGMISALILSLFCLAAVHQLNPHEPLQGHVISALMGLLVLLVLSFLAAWAKELRCAALYELEERRQIEARLRDSEERYRQLFHMASDAILVFDLEGKLLECNPMVANWLGYQREELLRMNIVELESFEYANRLSYRIKELKECGQALYESALARKDGGAIPIELNARLIDYQGQPAVFSIARDISQRKAIELAEHDQRVLADALRDIAADLTSTLQLEEVLDRILKNIQRVLHHDAASIMLLEDDVVYIKKHRGYAERGQAEKLAGASIQLDEMPLLAQMVQSRLPLIVPDVRASEYWRDFRSTAWVRSYAGAPITYQGKTIGFINIDSALPGFFKEEHAWRLQAFAYHAAVAIQNARLYTHVQQLAQVDEFTGLLNRRGLIDVAQREVTRALRYQHPLSILLIDVDNFKTYNDVYSYAVGDEILSSMARRVRGNVRQNDLVSRWGGDEFVVVLLESNREQAIQAAEHVRRVVTTAPFETRQGPLLVTISIGVAVLDQNHMDLNAMIHAAGDGVHQAKATGRNQVVVQPTCVN